MMAVQVSGSFKSMFALTSRKTQGWGMVLISGLLGMIIGILILALAARNPGPMAMA